MVRLLMSVVMVLLWTAAMPAMAQMGGGKRGHRGEQKSDAAAKPKVDEKAYKAALERIPEPKEKYDPWGIARAPTPAHPKN